MKILFKRNLNSSSSLPTSGNAGEPIWFKDKLYVGSIGTEAGGSTTAGKPVFIGPFGAERGLSITNEKIGHSNTSITAKSLGLYKVSFDDYGHITGSESFSLPDVNNGKLTVSGSGLLSGSGSFTANQSGNTTITITHNTRTETSTDGTKAINSTNPTFETFVYTFDEAGHEISKQKITNTITFPSAADLGITGVMHFKGVLTTLPNATTSDSYANGDVILVGTKEYVRNGKTSSAAGTWVELGDEGSHALKTVTITGTGALSGGGSLEANRTITHNNSGVTAGSYGASANASPNHGGTFNVPYVTVDTYGHVTAASTKTITLPAQYSHPTGGANASAGPQDGATLDHGGTFNVPYVTVDNYGHVTAASTKTFTLPTLPSTMTPSSHTHGNVSNTGTLTDTAAAPVTGDYIVIRDATNKTIQTSTIDASKVSTLVTNLDNKTAGNITQPIFFKNGAPTAFSTTVGGAVNPVYMNAGTITACSSTIGSSSQPVYMNAGTITACDTIDGGTF